jgi:hypothetical protein
MTMNSQSTAMSANWYIAQMAATGAAIVQLLEQVERERARWRPAPNEWSMLEVINHLVDEEREDFRQRIDLTLHAPKREWPPIDPERWVTERAYQQRDLAQSLAQFQAERQQSLQWLRSLADADWSIGRRHPAGFELRAGDLLASWAAHDLLHLRQLIELHYHTLALHAAPFEIGYAGDWE